MQQALLQTGCPALLTPNLWCLQGCIPDSCACRWSLYLIHNNGTTNWEKGQRVCMLLELSSKQAPWCFSNKLCELHMQCYILFMPNRNTWIESQTTRWDFQYSRHHEAWWKLADINGMAATERMKCHKCINICPDKTLFITHNFSHLKVDAL